MPHEHERTSSSNLLGGRYLLGEAFASGGMGTVHLGRVVGAGGFSRVVAIKRLSPGLAGDISFRRMLLDEARFASRIRHPNVVPMLDVIEEGRDLYVVMEYIHGVPLSRFAGEGAAAKVPRSIALGIVEAVLHGLHAAHEARAEDGTALGIVHRDVSPQNVLLGADGVPRLIDFGVAKAATRLHVTEPGVLKGKLAYMAPEQLVGEPVAREADLYSCAVLSWELLAGRRLFEGDVGERVRRLDEAIAPPIATRGEGSDAALDALVLRGLARDPSRRFATAEAMVGALRAGRSTASSREIAAWVKEVAADELELSEERVRLFEQNPTSDADGVSREVSVVDPTPAPAASAPIPPASASDVPRGRVWRGVAALLAIGVGGAGLVVAREARVHRASPEAPPIASIAVTTASAPPSAPPASSEAVVPVATPPAPIVSSVASGIQSAASAKGPASHSRHTVKGRCDPPYTVDSNGFKHYDRSCF